MLKLFKYFTKTQVLTVLICVGFIVLQVWLDLKMPDYLKAVIELSQKPESAMKEILWNGGLMLTCAFGSLLLAVTVGFFSARLATGFGAELRKQLFFKTMDFSMEEIGRFSTPSLITRTTNDITHIRMLISMGMQALIKAPILAVWAIIKISGKNWQWMASTAVAIGILIILIMIVILFALPKFKAMQKLVDNLNKRTRENLTGIKVVRSFNAEGFQEGKFEKANEELTQTQLFTGRVMSLMMPGMTLIMSGLTLAIYWLGAYIINSVGSATDAVLGGDIQGGISLALERVSLLGDMMVFTSYAMQVIMAFILLTMVFIMLPRAVVAGNRINEVLTTKLSVVDGTVTKGIDEKRGEVEFKNVSFTYPDAQESVLENVSFVAKKGETIAFIGSTGSGKSTLINLIPRFYDATSGQVLVGGVDVKDYTLKALHEKIGYVSQRAVIFSGSVRSNIEYGANEEGLKDEQLNTATEISQAKEFIEGLEGGFDAFVSQCGTNFSGGQKQRLSIARAIAKNPEIYIFDDSFSALDYKTDRALRLALKEKTKGATCLIVGQRIGTIRDADKIMVLDEGKVVGFDTHSNLLKTCKVYQEIAYSQLSKEELKDE